MPQVVDFNRPAGSRLQLLLAALAAVSIGAAVSPVPAAAAPEGSLTLQLNAAQTVGSACRVTMVARNGLDVALSEFGLDIVVFDDTGAVSDFAAVDLGALPPGKTRVRQYDIAKRGCEAVTALLVNEVRSCAGEGVDPAGCLAALKTSSRLDISLDQ